MTDEQAAVESASATASQEAAFSAAMAASPAPIVTFILIGLNVLAFLARVVLVPASLLHPTTRLMVAWGADFGPLTLHGEWWRVVTACFLHFSLIHIGMNMFILLQVGLLTERLFGNLRFFVLYMLAGLGGSIAGLWVHPVTVSAGASGAVFGVYGALIGFLLFQRNVVPSSRAWGIAKSAAIFIVYNIVYSLASPQTDLAAHVGGLLTGFVAGSLLARPIPERSRELHPVLAISVALCGVLATWAAIATLSARAATPREELINQLVKGNSVTVGKNNQVIYSGQATQPQAQALAQALLDAHYFSATKADIVVLLTGATDGPTVSLLTNEMDTSRPTDGSKPVPVVGERLVPYPWNDPDFLASVQGVGVSIAPSIGGPPIKLAILDRNGAVEKVLEIEYHKWNADNGGTVWYSDGATEADATALGKALVENKFFQGQPRRVLLSKDGTDFVVSFMVKEGGWDDARISQSFQLLGRKVAKSLPGPAVRIRLIDKDMQPKKELALN